MLGVLIMPFPYAPMMGFKSSTAMNRIFGLDAWPNNVSEVINKKPSETMIDLYNENFIIYYFLEI
jgi:hypothetical protein